MRVNLSNMLLPKNILQKKSKEGEMPAKNVDLNRNTVSHTAENSQDVFVHDAEFKEEIELYEVHKRNPLDAPYEVKKTLRELLEELERNKYGSFNVDQDTAQLRDELIEKIENFFETEEMQGEERARTSFIEMMQASAKTSKEQAEALAEAIKKMRACLEIAAKINRGTASEEERRFLMKTSPTMYAMAVARESMRKEDDEEKEKKTTVDIDFEDEDEISLENAVNNITSGMHGAN